MTATQSNHSQPADSLSDMLALYRRLAIMDPPALRSLAVDLQRISHESAASAVGQTTSAIQATAGRDAQRVTAALAALTLLETE